MSERLAGIGVRVFDKEGRELASGAEVVTSGFGAMPPGHVHDAGKVLRVDGDPHDPLVWVRWPDGDTTCDDWYPVYAHPTAGAFAFTCPDLTLINPNQGGSDGC